MAKYGYIGVSPLFPKPKYHRRPGLTDFVFWFKSRLSNLGTGQTPDFRDPCVSPKFTF